MQLTSFGAVLWTIRKLVSIFQKSNVGRDKIRDFNREFAEKNDLLMKAQRMLFSSYKLNNGIVKTELLKF